MNARTRTNFGFLLQRSLSFLRGGRTLLETLKRLNMEDFVKLKLTERQLLELIDTFADCAGLRETESLSQGSKDYIALMVLPGLIPPAVFRMGPKTVRTTVSDAMKAFIDLKPVGANMVEYLQAAEQTRPYPCTLVLGGEDCCSQAFTQFLPERMGGW
ncbi:hypothetical protein PFLUV_G00208240 [Perca fluviatilis]|uniref:Uncharacterized protein n=1 Tax=Perca fluviatilis TaxID=8168 RepID=A0A6A5EJX1_PERFL|nr:hypothetical protein PFLUV_G00208240 [Perca fluviatilis]